MHTPAAERETNEKHGVGAAAKQVAEHASSLARLELELAGLELKRKAGALGAGVVLGVAAALLALYALGFGFATIAAGLATPRHVDRPAARHGRPAPASPASSAWSRRAGSSAPPRRCPNRRSERRS